jgi:hypothetical protein
MVRLPSTPGRCSSQNAFGLYHSVGFAKTGSTRWDDDEVATDRSGTIGCALAAIFRVVIHHDRRQLSGHVDDGILPSESDGAPLVTGHAYSSAMATPRSGNRNTRHPTCQHKKQSTTRQELYCYDARYWGLHLEEYVVENCLDVGSGASSTIVPSFNGASSNMGFLSVLGVGSRSWRYHSIYLVNLP